MVKFTRQFSLEEPSGEDIIHIKTQKTLQLFFEPEKDFWMVLTLNVPFERKEKDGRESIDYYSDDVHESVYKNILKQSYYSYRMFNDTFYSNSVIGDMCDERHENLKASIENHMMRNLPRLNLHSADFLDVIQCLQYQPVTHLLFFRIVNFVNMLTSSHIRVKHCVFLHNQEIIYSTLKPMDLIVLNDHISMQITRFLQHKRNAQNFDDDQVLGCFILENRMEPLIKASKVYIYENGVPQVYRIAIFHILDCSLVMLVEDSPLALNDEFSDEIKFSMGPQLSLISREISENILQFQTNHTTAAKPEDVPAQERYIYFNHKNYRSHACLYDNDKTSSINSRENRKTSLSMGIMNLLCDLYDSDDSNNGLIDSEKETILKTYNDYWICKKSYNSRSLYLILHKSSTLIEIAEESQKLSSEIVKNVYFTNQQ